MISNHKFTGAPFPVEMRYTGEFADSGLISFYDLSRALIGFERSLALTTHFVLNNNEVITQVTSLRGARILCAPPKEGSFKLAAVIASLSGGAFALGTLDSDNPLGHLVYSVYDYAIHEATGQKVDYDKSLRETYEDAIKERTEGFLIPKKSQIESLIEKIEPAIIDMHRPITMSETADELELTPGVKRKSDNVPLKLNRETFDRLRFRKRGDEVISISGRISSFNMNTFNGRVFSEVEARPIPFSLAPAGRSPSNVELIGNSLAENIRDDRSDSGIVEIDVFRTASRTGRTTKYTAIAIRPLRNNSSEVADDPLLE